MLRLLYGYCSTVCGHFAIAHLQNGQLTAQKRSLGNDDTDDSSEVPTKRSLEMDTGAFYSKTTPKSARKDTGQKLLRKAKEAMVAKQASSNSNSQSHNV